MTQQFCPAAGATTGFSTRNTQIPRCDPIYPESLPVVSVQERLDRLWVVVGRKETPHKCVQQKRAMASMNSGCEQEHQDGEASWRRRIDCRRDEAVRFGTLPPILRLFWHLPT